MYTIEKTKQFSDILEELGNLLDITPQEHDAAVNSYKKVGEWLASSDSPLARFKPEILPQGSFLLQTMIRPINDEDGLDIDLVCKLEDKIVEWTQYDLKKIVGDRLKADPELRRLLKVPDGRRCWTLNYKELKGYHMDILPCIVATGYRDILEKAFAVNSLTDVEKLGVRITDKKQANYNTSTNIQEWLKSNPFGYGIWFAQQATLNFERVVNMSESVRPVPKYQSSKLPLQRVVQILKRHRDIMFNGDEDKPISIIITTLAAKAYQKETDILTALVKVIEEIPKKIQTGTDPKSGRKVKVIANPVNPQENFADKWIETPRKEKLFYEWIEKVKNDIEGATQQEGLHNIKNFLKVPFGENITFKAFESYGTKQLSNRISGQQHMTTFTGTLGAFGHVKTPPHNFHGKK